MKEFVFGLVLVAVISVAAAFALGAVDMSARTVYQQPANVRL
jgi:hypothetical protein